MIEIISVLAAGVFLIYVVRKSRSEHERIKTLSQKERDEFKATVNYHYRKMWLEGGSFTHVPIWVVVIVIVAFSLAALGGLYAVT
ncbi:hypothetical protein MWU49_00755 [Alcanivorax sp. S6407]|uniref:hypothetical protein n=1 Tax=Alcanivorax sp. S6407 TaxID=2926424 RepID=UPI001FF6E9E3|nr:hypothetical protein [Alcanivorax sp. S6407]MCK0152221.1 hypothetical protein [Alcanivorax sp. S6407]